MKIGTEITVRRIFRVIRRPTRLARLVPLAVKFQYRAFRNWLHAVRHPAATMKSWKSLNKVRRSFRQIAQQHAESEKVPSVFHFVYGFAGAEDFPYYGYLAVLSALKHNPGFVAVFHYCHEPKGEWWEKTKSIVEANQIPDFEYFRFSRLYHYAHKADVVRLLALNIIGGIYLDIDTLTLRDFEPLRAAPFVMGVQPTTASAVGGLCNAVMMSKAKSEFSTRWLKQYKHFRSKGRDEMWDFHSVKLPLRLYFRENLGVSVVPYTAFFPMLWNDVRKYFMSEGTKKNIIYMENTYTIHLWNNFNNDILLNIDQYAIRNSTSLYSYYALKALPEEGI